MVRRSPNAAVTEKSLDIYTEQREVEVQLWAKRFIGQDKDRIMKHIIAAPLEGTPEKVVAADNTLAYKQSRLEFHIPAICLWMRYAGPELFQHLNQV